MDVTEAEWGLLRTATGFSVDGHESRQGFSLATHELERSGTLQTAFESSEEGSRVPVRLTHSQLAQWCAYVRGKGSEGEPTTVELQQILQVSSSLLTNCWSGSWVWTSLHAPTRWYIYIRSRPSAPSHS